MEYGKFTLYTDQAWTAQNAMEPMGVNSFVVDESIRPDATDGLACHRCRADCSLSYQCVYCGEEFCVGCGQEAVIVYVPETVVYDDAPYMAAVLLTACVSCHGKIPEKLIARMERG